MNSQTNNPSNSAIIQAFWAIERDLDLVNWSIQGYKPWSELRYVFYDKVRREFGGGKVAHPSLAKSVPPTPPTITSADLEGIINYPRKLSRFQQLRTKNHIAIRGGNRITADGTDLYTRHWSAAFGDKIVTLSDTGPILSSHRSNLLDPRLDPRWVSYAAVAGLESGNKKVQNLKRTHLDRIAAIASRFEEDFQVDIGISTYMVMLYTNRSTLVQKMYREFCQENRIAAIALVNAVGKGALIQGARESGATTIELQHGYIGRFHMGYSWPDDKPAWGIPDYLFTHGQYWGDSTPLANKAVVTGAPWVPRDTTEDQKQESMILFMSQGLVGEPLFKFAVQAAKALPNREIVFHLHPSEFLEQYEDLANTLEAPDNLSLSDGTVGKVYELMKQASINVGVYSTTLFEGMAMKGRTIIVRLPGAEYMDEAIARGDAIIVDTPEEFIDRIDEAPYCSNPDDYYAPPVLGKDLRSLIKNC